MAGINGSEFIVLLVLAVIILGPEKLPEYTRAFTQWLRRMRDMAEGAKTQFKEETGTDFDEVNWRKYDPRQYDPRRIIREALTEPVGGSGSSTAAHRAQALTGVAPEDLHGGLTRQDIADMDPRSLFRRPGGTGSSAAEAADVESAAVASATGTATADAELAPVAAAVVPGAGTAVVGGAAVALMASGRAEAMVAEERPAPVPAAAGPDPLELLGLAPAPFDVDAT